LCAAEEPSPSSTQLWNEKENVGPDAFVRANDAWLSKNSSAGVSPRGREGVLALAPRNSLIKNTKGTHTMTKSTITLLLLLLPLLSGFAADQPKSPDVTIDNFSFTPATLTIPVGTAVRWTNHDDIPHTVASDLFKSKALDTDQTFSYTFTKPGTYTYFCSIHPKMTAKVIVQ
jgi:plastocyanin